MENKNTDQQQQQEQEQQEKPKYRSVVVDDVPLMDKVRNLVRVHSHGTVRSLVKEFLQAYIRDPLATRFYISQIAAGVRPSTHPGTSAPKTPLGTPAKGVLGTVSINARKLDA